MTHRADCIWTRRTMDILWGALLRIPKRWIYIWLRASRSEASGISTRDTWLLKSMSPFKPEQTPMQAVPLSTWAVCSAAGAKAPLKRSYGSYGDRCTYSSWEGRYQLWSTVGPSTWMSKHQRHGYLLSELLSRPRPTLGEALLLLAPTQHWFPCPKLSSSVCLFTCVFTVTLLHPRWL